jgi:hypothetical protein
MFDEEGAEHRRCFLLARIARPLGQFLADELEIIIFWQSPVPSEKG